MLVPLLFLGLLPANISGNGEPTAAQVDVTPELQLSSPRPATTTFTSLFGARATLFLHGLTDDATPLPLQPFLQRESVISLHLQTAIQGTHAVGNALDVSGDFYPQPWLTVRGAFTVQAVPYLQSGTSINDLARVRAEVAMGIRIADLRIDLGYRYAPGLTFDALPDRVAARNDGAILVNLRAVVIEHIDFQLSLATSFAGDLIGGFSSDYHASRRLGLLWGIVFGHGIYDISNASPKEDLFGAHFGLSFWWNSKIALAANFAPAWHFYDTGQGGFEERFTISLSTRL